jgi:hypothetical protein
MKKIILSVGMALTFNNAYSQWVNKSVNNGFDTPYKIAYNHSKEGNDIMVKLENVDGDVAFYLQGEYFCDDDVRVDISFLVNGVYKKYYATGGLSSDNTCLFLIDNMTNDVTLYDFKMATLMKIRVNDPTCGELVLNFSMSGSTSAMTFVKNQ